MFKPLKKIEKVQSYISKFSRNYMTDLQHGDLLEFCFPDINSPLVKRYMKLEIPSDRDATLVGKRNEYLRLIVGCLETNEHRGPKRQCVKRLLKGLSGCDAVLTDECHEFIKAASMAVENCLEWRPTGPNQSKVDDELRKFLVNMKSGLHIGVGKGEMLHRLSLVDRCSYQLSSEQKNLIAGSQPSD